MKTLLTILLAVPAAAFSAEISCPERYPIQGERIKAPDGWTGRIQGSLHLIQAGVLVGPLEQNGELRGTERKTRGGHETRYAGLNDFQESLQKWVFCSYGAGGEVRLLRRIADDTEQCVIAYRRTKAAHAPTIMAVCNGRSR